MAHNAMCPFMTYTNKMPQISFPKHGYYLNIKLERWKAHICNLTVSIKAAFHSLAFCRHGALQISYATNNMAVPNGLWEWLSNTAEGYPTRVGWIQVVIISYINVVTFLVGPTARQGKGSSGISSH